MTEFVLLTVEDRFQLSTGKLVVVPDFPAPDGFGRSGVPMSARLVVPSGDEVPCEVSLHVTHFNIPDPTDLRSRWRLTCEVLGVTKETVEIGSRIIVSDDALAKTLGLATLQP